MRIIFFGTPIYVVPVLKALEDNFQLVGVVTSPDKKVSRKQTLQSSPVKVATGPFHDTKILTPESFNQVFENDLKDLKPDLFIVASYGKIIPKNILNIPKFGAINIHPSLLPKYRGASPIQTTILNGDKTTGITLIKMDEKMDHGPIIFQEKFALSDQDTFQSLSNKMFQRSSEFLSGVLDDFVKGKIKPKEQNHKKATFSHIIKKQDGYFNIDNPPSTDKLEKMVRAYYPWPNVWTKWSFDSAQDKKGKIVKFYPNQVLQLEGKKPSTFRNFLNGYPNFPLKSI